MRRMLLHWAANNSNRLRHHYLRHHWMMMMMMTSATILQQFDKDQTWQTLSDAMSYSDMQCLMIGVCVCVSVSHYLCVCMSVCLCVCLCVRRTAARRRKARRRSERNVVSWRRLHDDVKRRYLLNCVVCRQSDSLPLTPSLTGSNTTSLGSLNIIIIIIKEHL